MSLLLGQALSRETGRSCCPGFVRFFRLRRVKAVRRKTARTRGFRTGFSHS